MVAAVVVVVVVVVVEMKLSTSMILPTTTPMSFESSEPDVACWSRKSRSAPDFRS